MYLKHLKNCKILFFSLANPEACYQLDRFKDGHTYEINSPRLSKIIISQLSEVLQTIIGWANLLYYCIKCFCESLATYLYVDIGIY